MLMFPPFRWLLRKYVLPKPGEGATREEQKKFFLRLHGYGTGSQGTKVKATLYYPNDPGYVDTARMMVESALCTIFEEDVR